MILKSVSDDPESGLAGLNVVLINPSFEEEYRDATKQNNKNSVSIYQHLALGKKEGRPKKEEAKE
jgi:hypothetical protein